jgi:hypothetical protein
MGKQRNEFEVYQRTAGFDFLTEFDASGNILYFGEAYPGALTTEAKWRIWKGTYDSDNRQTELRWANGSDNYIHKWTERASLNYTVA